ncbi:molybdopterin oxidoreductase, iron-sulfur binding subunit [Chthoniobacter flavus Ellin428]|uniref:Molybdopterin oxidoreductase, iron-sulfur binding subunit n=1 Tax=Chthoniobacter flavus Ellin428 TaxID=497964 RepID=B4DA25_9BACT|nr:4Fe-4S dicluster domain-containing protein [Chthoniobacter flavus]EDY16652.1 molybdopterin oxidoreductase, iron-sulfur binding subunit [Chthoniobacter flavus Ellin428]TCO87227.1 quinol:cytochrome c oxidoreductase iron-sulfur protein precursor [Chthoniobacter flavus]
MSDSLSPANSEGPLRDDDEFVPGASEWPEDLSRRRFLQVMAASLALAGGACTRLPHGEILPYIRQPELLIPGKPLYFATAMDFGGVGHGLLVRSNEGRPTKIEGNPDHPTSLGRSSVHAQAALLTLYDPARSHAAMKLGHPETWEGLLGELLPEIEKWKESAGAGVHLLTQRIASPTLLAQVHQFLTKFPKAQWHFHDAAFPRSPMPAKVRLEQAQVVLSLDAELFGYGGANVPNALAFAKGRRREENAARLYAVEVTPTFTGTMADHRRALSPSALVKFAQDLVVTLHDGSKSSDNWSAALLRDLQKHKGQCVVVAGEFQPPSVHEAARQINEALGNIGKTIDYLPGDDSLPRSGLQELVTAMQRGEVGALLIFGGNPAYDSPVDLSFGEALAKVPFSMHLGLYPNETAQVCRWHLPESHFLETWSDVRASDGSESIAQPLIEPLYPSKSAHEFVAVLLEQVPTTGYDIIRGAWEARHKMDNFENFWRKSVHDGVAALPKTPGPNTPEAATASAEKAAAESKSLELVIRPDAHVLDGRFAENAWLQELPKPLTQLTWENAALIAPQTARANHLEHGDVVELRYRDHAIRTPVWVLPGQAEGCITVHLGYGRNYAGPVGSGLGSNAFTLQTSDAPWGGPGVEVHKIGGGHRFSTTQSERSMEDRDPVRLVTAGKPAVEIAREDLPETTETLYPKWKYAGPAWGMVIDLSACIGCSACTIACQAENNIPVVGREQVLRRREMHWIRVDRYFDGDNNAPRLLHQPVPCMHCENAPCELVCPVGATVHDHEGLNVMVYNRCVGTRYCSNNCPYKVRRFNFLKFNDDHSETLKLMRNPNVSVRMRGVMEKCTYCLQRISAARIDAEKEKRKIRDGEVIPACAQACPADAIVFGDILDPASRVAAMKESPRNYSLLGELNTKPRTTYLARMQNPNPEIG